MPDIPRIVIISMGPHTQILINQIEMVQRCAARFCLNDYTSREAAVSEILKQLYLQQLVITQTNRRPTILHKAIYGHLSLSVNNHLQPVQLPRESEMVSE